MSETYLALDLGGTKLLVGEVDNQGNILNHKRYSTGYVDQTTALGIIKNSIDDYIQTTGWANGVPPVAMGVGLVGRIDNVNGVWHQIDISRTEPLPLAKELSGIYQMPCYIDNDVKAATRAEKRWGFGKQSDDFIYINIGTGIAAGIVTGGNLIRGSHYNAGEVGHTHVGVSLGIECVCGREDCVELIAAGVGFDTCAHLLAKSYSTSLPMPQDERVDVKKVFELYGKDSLCTILVDNAAKAIASLIMNLVRVSDPDTIIVGGGIVSSGFILPFIEKNLNKHTMRFVSNGVKLTQLNPEFIGLLGAASIVCSPTASPRPSP